MNLVTRVRYVVNRLTKNVTVFFHKLNTLMNLKKRWLQIDIDYSCTNTFINILYIYKWHRYCYSHIKKYILINPLIKKILLIKRREIIQNTDTYSYDSKILVTP